MQITPINYSPVRNTTFKGVSPFNREAQKHIRNNGIHVDNLFGINEDVKIDGRFITEEKDKKLFGDGLSVEVFNVGDKKYVKVMENDTKEIFRGYEKVGAKCPNLSYAKGKFDHHIVIEDEDTKIMMLKGSKITADDGSFEYIMFSDEEPKNQKTSFKGLSFTGNVYVSTLNKESKTLEAVKNYSYNKLYTQAPVGDYKDIVEANQPNLLIPAGGFGERFYNVNAFINGNSENKPSCSLPTKNSYRIIGTTLNMAASAGIITGKDKYAYLSQAHSIDEDKEVKHVRKYDTDGGAFAEALKRDIISDDKDAIILNADIFTNADITRAYKALKTLPNAALVIPYYPVNPERAKSFGLIGTEVDENGNQQIKKFIEKPKYTNKIPSNASIEEKADWMEVQKAEINGNYMANPGMYFMSKEAVKVLKDINLEEKGAGFLGKHVIPKIVELCNAGKLVDENGNPMKVYTVPLEAKGGKLAVWDDIGSAEAYVKMIQDVAKETKENEAFPWLNKYYGVPNFVLQDFKNNTEIETGVVKMSRGAGDRLEIFKDKYGVDEMKGNILVL